MFINRITKAIIEYESIIQNHVDTPDIQQLAMDIIIDKYSYNYVLGDLIEDGQFYINYENFYTE